MHPVADTIASLAPARGALHGADAQRRAFGSAQRQHARRFEAAAPAPPRRTNPVQSSAAADISAAAGHSRCCVPLENAAASSGGREAADGCDAAPFGVSRRSALFSVTIVTVAAAAAGIRPQPAKAVQGLTAGRVPGASRFLQRIEQEFQPSLHVAAKSLALCLCLPRFCPCRFLFVCTGQRSALQVSEHLDGCALPLVATHTSATREHM